MAVNLTATLASSAPEFMRSTRQRELVKIVGAAANAGDTSAAYNCQFVQNPVGVEGGAITGSISGQAVTFKAINALNSETVYVWVIGS